MIKNRKRHNLKHPQGLVEFNERVEFCKKMGKIVELGEYEHTRSTLQNDSLHLYCDLIAKALNDAGYTRKEHSVLDNDFIEVPFDMLSIKNGLWRKLQIKMFEIESTTKLTSRMINEIIDIITNWLAAKGISVEFPNKNRVLNGK